MIGAIIGAVGAIGSAIAGGIGASKAQRLKKKYLEKRETENTAWWQAEKNTTMIDRAEARAGATRLYEAIRNRDKARRATQAVLGGTDESVRAGQEADSNAMADYYAKVAEQGDALRRQADAQYRQEKRAIEAERAGLAAEQAQAAGNAIASGITAATSIAQGVAGAMSKSPSATTKGTIDTQGTASNANAGSPLQSSVPQNHKPEYADWTIKS